MATATMKKKERDAPIELEARARYFRVLGDPTRIQILEALIERERNVSELIELTGAPQSRVSNHLACLKWCRLVTAERLGRQVIYHIVDERVPELIGLSRSLPPEQCNYLAGCRRIGPDWI
jgi:DNA-binding transcriptional ArsR family regulator